MMNKQDAQRIADVLIEIGGRRPWVLLWTGGDGEHPEIVSSVNPDDLPEMVCTHLLRILRGELTKPDVIAREQ